MSAHAFDTHETSDGGSMRQGLFIETLAQAHEDGYAAGFDRGYCDGCADRPSVLGLVLAGIVCGMTGFVCGLSVGSLVNVAAWARLAGLQ